MPLQILIAVFLALAIWAGKTESGPGTPEKPAKPAKPARSENISISNESQNDELIIEDMSNRILITAIEHSNHRYTIVGQPKGRETKVRFSVDTTTAINESNKQHKRNTIYRAA